MAKRNSERVREISYTTGTGPIVLARPVIGFRTLVEAGCVDGDTADLTIEGVSSVGTPTGDWEVGTYTWSTGGVLTRTTITASSNGGAAVNWANGTRWVRGRSSGQVDVAGNSILVSGTPGVGNVLTASFAMGVGTVKWQDSLDGVTWTDIASATNLTFTLGSPQAGKKVRPIATSYVPFGSSVSVPAGASYTIRNAANIRTGLLSYQNAATQRVVWDWLGHSVITGYGSDNTTGTAVANVNAWAGSRITARVGKRFNTQVGGTWTRGAESFAIYHRGLFTLGGSAALAQGGAGVAGYRVLLAAADTIAFLAAGTAVLVKADTDAVGRQLRYTVNGGSVQTANAATNDPSLSGRFWYDVPITGLTAGDSIVLMGPTAGNVTVFNVDIDHRPAVPGLTIHTQAYAGFMGAQVLPTYLDDTDTVNPPTPAVYLGSSGNATRRNVRYSLVNRWSPSLVLVTFDINDMKAYGTSGQAWAWSLATLVRHFKAAIQDLNDQGFPVLYVAGPIRDPSLGVTDGNPYTQIDVIEAYKAASDTLPMCGFLDLTTPFTGATLTDRYNAQIATGYFLSEANAVHPNTSGSTYFGDMVFNAIREVV